MDRLLAGNASSGENGLGSLGEFVDQVRTAYSVTPDPEVEAAHLGAIMQQVQAAIQNGELAPRPSEPAAGLSRWRRVVARGAGASLAFKILGGAVAFAGTTGGLAAIEALPRPAQAPVATAVEAVTPFNIPGNEEKRSNDARGTLEVEEVPPTEPPPAAPNPNASFGQNVAEDAKQGGVSGPETSEAARQQAEQRRQEGQGNRPEDTPSQAPGQVPGPPAGAGPPPGGEPGGAGPQNGLDRAGQTPAGQNVPQSVPAGPPADSSSGS